MVTVKTRTDLEITGVSENDPLEFMGLSTDTKPLKAYDIIQQKEIDLPNGSSYMEIDTGSVSFFDGATKTWKAV